MTAVEEIRKAVEDARQKMSGLSKWERRRFILTQCAAVFVGFWVGWLIAEAFRWWF